MTTNYIEQTTEYQNLFTQFVADTKMAIRDQARFYNYLLDNGIVDIDETILAEQFKNYKNACP